MNTLINIGGDPNDPHYRYKRQRIELERVSKCGGMFRIRNIAQIIRQLKTNEQFKETLYKKFQKQLGIVIDKNGFFKGNVSIEKLEEILEEQIRKFLLCPRCSLPEWNGRNCRACGYVPLIESETKESKNKPKVSRAVCYEQARAVDAVKVLYSFFPRTKEIEADINNFWSIPENNAELHDKWRLYIENKYSIEP